MAINGLLHYIELKLPVQKVFFFLINSGGLSLWIEMSRCTIRIVPKNRKSIIIDKENKMSR